MERGGRFKRHIEKRMLHAFETGRVLPYLVGTIIVLVFAFAAVMRIVDQKDFESYGTALWWAVATVTTVGYGDVVPEEPVGRLVAALLMILGFSLLSLITGTIASTLVSRFMSRQSDERVLAAIARLEDRIARLEERRSG